MKTHAIFFFPKSTQSKSIRKTKFGASLLSPLGKETGGEWRAAEAGSQLPAGVGDGGSGAAGTRGEERGKEQGRAEEINQERRPRGKT